MYQLTGRILTINVLSEKSVQIVIQKQIKGKKTPIAVVVYGYWKTKVDELKLQKNDKIVGTLYIKSNLYKGKWYSDLYFNEVKRFVKKPKYNPITNTYETPNIKNKENELFEDEEIIGGGYCIDEKTGEIKF
jgi:hypothetical protein